MSRLNLTFRSTTIECNRNRTRKWRVYSNGNSAKIVYNLFDNRYHKTTAQYEEEGPYDW